MPDKDTSSIKTKKVAEPKKLSRFSNKRIVVLVAVLVIASFGGAYMLRQGQALGEVCGGTSSSCSPTVLECAALHPTLREGMARNGCVAAVQAFYNKGYGLTFVVIDGIYGPKTRNVTALYQKTQISSKPLDYSRGNVITAATWYKMGVDCNLHGPVEKYCTTHYRYR